MPILLLLVFVSVIAGSAALFAIGGTLAEPQLRAVQGPPEDLPLKALRIPRADGGSVAAWFADGDIYQGGIVLVHGIRSDRRQMLDRARFLFTAGYSVLLIDLQAHGETYGEQITFGYRESLDVKAAVDYLNARLSGRPVGVIGTSLGGAAALLGESPVDADAVVLEGVYSSIDRAVGNRLAIRFGEIGHWLAPFFVWQVKPRLGIHPRKLAPIAAIHRLDAPVMIIAGTDDRRTRLDESKGLYLRAKSPKRLWLINGARHEDFHRHSPADYERQVLEFLDRHLAMQVAQEEK
ncbi:MAG: alpha/beta fold hydrolase [Chromatiaceae bacterium]|jgi:alpha-beta hydrolase superfamily lysophospholipase